MHVKNDFWERERECERFFEASGPYFFITTEGLDWLLYKSREEFIVGTNLLAVSAAESGVVVVDDIQMNNHHHVMGAATYDKAMHFKEIFCDKMRRYQISLGNRSLKDWKILVEQTTDLRQFRQRIVYTDRNAYVARKDCTPTGYPWGSGNLLFNGNVWLQTQGEQWKELSIEARRKICRSHNVNFQANFRVYDGMILRSSFVDYHRTERMFNSANQYFSMLSKHGEADIEIAQMLGEKLVLPNEEVFQIVGSWHGGTSIRNLAQAVKYETAKKMKARLGCSNKQIIQVLQLPPEEVNRLFPQAI